MLMYPFLKDCRQHCVSLQGGHMSQLDPVTPLSVGAAAAGLAILQRFSLLLKLSQIA